MIELKVENAVAQVTLARAPVNAINDAWIDRFGAVIDDVARRAEISVFWVRSALPVFCAGADLALMRDAFSSNPERMVDVARRMQEVFGRLEAMDAVTIAEIGGAALGGGFELALACDLRVVADSARVGLPEAQLGLLPGAGGTQRLTRICGEALARRLILGAEVVSGTESVPLGLAQWSAPRAVIAQLAEEQVKRLASIPRDALAACKRCIRAAGNPGVEGYALEISETRRLYGLPETQRRVKEFLERKPG